MTSQMSKNDNRVDIFSMQHDLFILRSHVYKFEKIKNNDFFILNAYMTYYITFSIHLYFLQQIKAIYFKVKVTFITEVYNPRF